MQIIIPRSQVDDFFNEMFRALAAVAHDPEAAVVMEWPVAEWPVIVDDLDDTGLPPGAIAMTEPKDADND